LLTITHEVIKFPHAIYKETNRLHWR